MGMGKRFRHAIIDRLGIAGTEKVLDAGCGTGALLMTLKERYPGVVASGLDPDETALEIAKRKSKGKGLDIKWHLGFMEGCLLKMVPSTSLYQLSPFTTSTLKRSSRPSWNAAEC